MGCTVRFVPMAIALLAAACGGGSDTTTDPTPPPPPPPPLASEIAVRVYTYGAAADTDGYALLLDHAVVQTIGPQGVLLLRDLPSGHHTVALGEIASDCTPGPSDSATVDLGAGDSVTVSFVVRCPGRGTVRVITHTAGHTPDPDGYVVQVGTAPAQAMGVEDTLDFADVLGGSQQARIKGLASNCSVPAPEQSIYLTPPEPANVTFDVSCLSPGHGSIVLTINTVSINAPQLTALTAILDGSLRLVVPANGRATFADVEAGRHSVRLTLPGWCGVGLGTGETNPASVTVAAGYSVVVPFHVLCIG